MRTFVIGVAAVVSSFVAPVTAQTPGTWTQVVTPVRPFARERHAMVFDGAAGHSVLFGGHNGAYLSDTWTLGATGWVQRFPASSPPPRADHTMAYDPVRQRVVLFGGTNGATLTDIWEWDGTNWAQVGTNVFGVGTDGSAVYSPVLGGVFYNRATINLRWDGSSATVLNVPNPDGQSQKLVFHAPAGGIVGSSGGLTMRFQLPLGWQQIGSSQTFNVSQHGLAADPVHDRILIHGGQGFVGGGSSSGFPCTWQWNGAFWAQVSGQGTPLLYRHAMVFDAQRDTFVMFGGRHNNGGLRDQTWRWNQPMQAATYASYGAGCAGTLPLVPRLEPDVAWNTVPVLGGLFLVRVDRLPAGAPALGVIGFSDQQWSGLTLPFPLDNLGLPGCVLLAAPEATLALGVANAGGAVTWATSIPANQALVGLHFYQQAACIAPLANPTGLVFSNGGHGAIGI
jgi:hypothetical protein